MSNAVVFLFQLLLATGIRGQATQCEPQTEFCEVKEQCDPIRRVISEACASSDNCPYQADCVSGVCACTAGYKPTSDNTSCDRIKAKHNEVCADDNNCGDNMFCHMETAKCGCYDGYTPSADRMTCNVLMVPINSSCVMSAQCPINSICNAAGICSCSSGFNPVNGTCVVPPKKLDQPCSFHGECAAGTPNAYCDGVCKCPSGYENKASKCEILLTPIDGQCAMDANCPADAMCLAATCKCHPDFAPSADKAKCGKFCPKRFRIIHTHLSLVFLRSKLGGHCNSDGNCVSVEFTICNQESGLCDCEDGYAAINGSCMIQPKGVGEPCNVNIECWDKAFFASCYRGRCDCDPGFFLSNGQCILEVKNLGESCKSSYQCPRNSICDRECHDRCICKLGFEERDGQCYKKGSVKAPGDACEPGKDYCSSKTTCAGKPPRCTASEKAAPRCPAIDQPNSITDQCSDIPYQAFETSNETRFRFLCREAAEFIACVQYLTPGCPAEVGLGLYGKMKEYYTACCLKSGPTASCPLKFTTCTFRPCMRGATCVQKGESFECLCLTGFTGARCETNINDCASASCPSGATCEDLVNGFKCVCPAGYFGPRCDQKYFECTAAQTVADPRECDYFFICRGAGSVPIRERCPLFGSDGATPYQRLFDTTYKTCLLPSMFKPTSAYKLSPKCEIPAAMP